jgi:hypothetical protein
MFLVSIGIHDMKGRDWREGIGGRDWRKIGKEGIVIETYDLSIQLHMTMHNHLSGLLNTTSKQTPKNHIIEPPLNTLKQASPNQQLAILRPRRRSNNINHRIIQLSLEDPLRKTLAMVLAGGSFGMETQGEEIAGNLLGPDGFHLMDVVDVVFVP